MRAELHELSRKRNGEKSNWNSLKLRCLISPCWPEFQSYRVPAVLSPLVRSTFSVQRIFFFSSLSNWDCKCIVEMKSKNLQFTRRKIETLKMNQGIFATFLTFLNNINILHLATQKHLNQARGRQPWILAIRR